MRFICPPDRITDEAVQHAYLSGYDRIPWRNNVRHEDGELILERTVSDSGNLHIPWKVANRGQITLSTSTLMEREKPYHLPLELARGKIGQVRNQRSDWSLSGLDVSAEVDEKLADAVAFFAQAAVVQHGSKQSTDLADRAIAAALDAGDLLAVCYAEQVLANRRRGSQKLSAFLAGNVGMSRLDDYTSRQFVDTFNAANVPFSWREIQANQDSFTWDVTDGQVHWCGSSGLRVCGGPLLQFDQHYIPDWIKQCEGDFNTLYALMSSYVQAVVDRYRNRVDIWQCAGRVNTSEVLGLTEEERIRLVARAVELTRALDPDAPVLVSFDQPWAEYLSRREMDFPPLHFADALIRAGLGVSGLMLEINVGCYPGGTMTRDPLDFGRLIDYWSLLGVPLFLSLTVPSAWQTDPLSRRTATLPEESWTPKVQESWVSRYVPLLLAKPGVHGIIWNQLRDSEPHDFPHGGLFDLRRHPKPALRQLASIRKAHLE